MMLPAIGCWRPRSTGARPLRIGCPGTAVEVRTERKGEARAWRLAPGAYRLGSHRLRPQVSIVMKTVFEDRGPSRIVGSVLQLGPHLRVCAVGHSSGDDL